jgi:hypothetical protein
MPNALTYVSNVSPDGYAREHREEPLSMLSWDFELRAGAVENSRKLRCDGDDVSVLFYRDGVPVTNAKQFRRDGRDYTSAGDDARRISDGVDIGDPSAGRRVESISEIIGDGGVGISDGTDRIGGGIPDNDQQAIEGGMPFGRQPPVQKRGGQGKGIPQRTPMDLIQRDSGTDSSDHSDDLGDIYKGGQMQTSDEDDADLDDVAGDGRDRRSIRRTGSSARDATDYGNDPTGVPAMPDWNAEFRQVVKQRKQRALA